MKSFWLLISSVLFLLPSLVCAATPGTLAADTQIPLVVEGKTVGSMTLKAGTSVSITKVLPNNEGVLITRGEAAPVKLPVEAISPESLAAAQAAQTAASAAQAAAIAAAQATPTPTPSPVATAQTAQAAPSTHPSGQEATLSEEEFCGKVLSLIVNKGPATAPFPNDSKLGANARALVHCPYAPGRSLLDVSMGTAAEKDKYLEKVRPVEFKKGQKGPHLQKPVLTRLYVSSDSTSLTADLTDLAVENPLNRGWSVPITWLTPESLAAALSNWEAPEPPEKELSEEEFCGKVLSLIVNKGTARNVNPSGEPEKLGPNARAVFNCTYAPAGNKEINLINTPAEKANLLKKVRPLVFTESQSRKTYLKEPFLKRLVTQRDPKNPSKVIFMVDYEDFQHLGYGGDCRVTDITPESLAAALSNWAK